nr:uncharacterized protein CI109_000910 [Kwoniella shandongensis]KAA5530730.1 hypothetical protein CI109_000910 [Kwoniella shandongensis]
MTIANLSTSSILLTPLPKLADTLRCKIPFAQSLVREVSKGVVPIPRRLDEVYEEESGERSGQQRQGGDGVLLEGGVREKGKVSDRGKWMSTGDEGMDRCLGGGLRRGCLYEITGESAAGKSHLALTLALSSQLPSLTSSPGGSLILTSERELSTDRLVQLAKSLLATHEPVPIPTAADADVVGYAEEQRVNRRVKGLLDNVLTNRVGDVDALEHALNYAIPAMLEKRSSSSSTVKPIRLIVLDSITALFRGGSNNDDKPTAPSSLSLTERSKRLCSVADQLKLLAVKFDLVILVINQVSDVFTRQGQGRQSTPTPTSSIPMPSSSFTQTQPFVGYSTTATEMERDPPMIYSSQARWFSGQSDNLNKEASLGIVWANAINVRIMLSRTGRRRLLHQDDLRPSTSTKKRKRGVIAPSPMPSATQEGVTLGLGVEVDDIKPTLIRKMHVVFSPFSPSSTIDYAITPSGVHSLPESYKVLDVTETVRKRREGERKEREKEREDQRRQIGLAPLHPQTQSQSQEEQEEGEEFGDEVFDEFGELPAEFWEEYQLGEEGGVERPVGEVPSA